MHGNRDDFSAKTKELLALRAGCRCSNPFCRTLTCGAGTPVDTVVNIGVAAHICAAAPGGKRYDPEMTRETRRHIHNGIWLCQSCAKLIDSDEQCYTIQILHEWKSRAEQETVRELARGRNKTQEAETRFSERIQRISAAIHNCEDYKVLMECIAGLQIEMDALVSRMETLQDKVDLAKRNGDKQWERIYQIQFGYTLSLFEQLSNDLREMYRQANRLRDYTESMTQDALDRYGRYYSNKSIYYVPSVDKVIAERVEELLRWLIDGWQRVAVLEVKLDEFFAATHQYELMTLELLEASSD